uniref:Uncharacterized protein n=1 Tax=Oryza barthii TaxID=65489 RepID=A0A0D3HUA6_9ORYZ
RPRRSLPREPPPTPPSSTAAALDFRRSDAAAIDCRRSADAAAIDCRRSPSSHQSSRRHRSPPPARPQPDPHRRRRRRLPAPKVSGARSPQPPAPLPIPARWKLSRRQQHPLPPLGAGSVVKCAGSPSSPIGVIYNFEIPVTPTPSSPYFTHRYK